MGGALSRIACHVKKLFDDLRNAFGSNETRPNPTMEELEVLIAQREQGRKGAKPDQCTTEEYLAERLWRVRMEGRETMRRERRERARAEETSRAAGDAAREPYRRTFPPIRPLSVPTQAEYAAARQRLQYIEGLLHFAMAGVAGSGKSSLLNALLGQKNGERGAAPTGTSETTSNITRYPDPHPDNPFIWYDVPGAGTLSVPGWQYFQDQALYVFDAIFVVFDSRFTETDVAVLQNCELFNVPAYIVRSKALQNVQNELNDMGDVDATARGTGARREAEDLRRKAREKYIFTTRQTVKKNLSDAGLPDQRVYIVDKDILQPIVRGDADGNNCFDEWELLRDLLDDAHRKRVAKAD